MGGCDEITFLLWLSNTYMVCNPNRVLSKPFHISHLTGLVLFLFHFSPHCLNKDRADDGHWLLQRFAVVRINVGKEPGLLFLQFIAEKIRTFHAGQQKSPAIATLHPPVPLIGGNGLDHVVLSNWVNEIFNFWVRQRTSITCCVCLSFVLSDCLLVGR